MCICVNAERSTHQCTYTYRYIAKPVQSSMSSFRPARTHKREPSTHELESESQCMSPRVCLYHTPACVSGAWKGGWVFCEALERGRERKGR